MLVTNAVNPNKVQMLRFLADLIGCFTIVLISRTDILRLLAAVDAAFASVLGAVVSGVDMAN